MREPAPTRIYRKARPATFVALIVGIFLAIASPGCGNGDFEKPLPNGFAIARTNSNTICIWIKNGKRHPSQGGDNMVVGNKVEEIAIVGNWVVGRIEKSPESDNPNAQTPGYFILDTATGEIQKGLDYQHWWQLMDSKGIPQPVTLVSPYSL